LGIDEAVDGLDADGGLAVGGRERPTICSGDQLWRNWASTMWRKASLRSNLLPFQRRALA
jgi:hypothetical protein